MRVEVSLAFALYRTALQGQSHPKIQTSSALMHAAICAIIRWTMWNTIFLVAVVQAHNTNPYWRSGMHLPSDTQFPRFLFWVFMMTPRPCTPPCLETPALCCQQNLILDTWPLSSHTDARQRAQQSVNATDQAAAYLPCPVLAGPAHRGCDSVSGLGCRGQAEGREHELQQLDGCAVHQ